MRATMAPLEDRMRACAYCFWFETYLGAPDFPRSHGLFPLDPSLRQRYISHQSSCHARWLSHAREIGGTSQLFEQACVSVRAALFGREDVLMHIRGLASPISEQLVRPNTDRIEDLIDSFQRMHYTETSMTHKILVAIDFSRCAQRALEEALQEAKLRHAQLEILHVVDYGFLKHENNPYELPDIRLKHVLAGSTLLAKAAERAKAFPVEHSLQLIDDMSTLGDVAHRVVQYAGTSGAELVVTGSHGHTGLSQVVMGSVAAELVRHCPVPVLVVREDMTRPAESPVAAYATSEVPS
ncbi:universal stress protein [Cupriavidus pauculus]|uniref:universal stress protein n=1 Tax=Cupriavidus pauculus TaxID=82633 RepID=UPI001F1D3454|nr:universal stress protein [Cupriavidus pauculus]